MAGGERVDADGREPPGGPECSEQCVVNRMPRVVKTAVKVVKTVVKVVKTVAKVVNMAGGGRVDADEREPPRAQACSKHGRAQDAACSHHCSKQGSQQDGVCRPGGERVDADGKEPPGRSKQVNGISRVVKTVVNVWQVVNESMLTGESLPVLKTAVPVHSADDNGFPYTLNPTH